MTYSKPLFVTIMLLAALFAAAPVNAHDDLHEQIVAVTKEIRRNPGVPCLYMKRAELYRLHAEWKRSEADFFRARSLDPNLAVVDLGLGRLWLDSGQLQRARRALEAFVTRQPDAYEGVFTIARLYVRLGQPALASKHFTRAIELAPHASVELYLERAAILARSRRFDAALDGLDEGIRRLGGIVTLQTAAIDLEVKRGRYAAALERVDRLAETMPRKETFLLSRAEILLRAGKPCAARTNLIASQHGFDGLPAERKNVRAVRMKMKQVQALLNKPEVRGCPVV